MIACSILDSLALRFRQRSTLSRRHKFSPKLNSAWRICADLFLPCEWIHWSQRFHWNELISLQHFRLYLGAGSKNTALDMTQREIKHGKKLDKTWIMFYTTQCDVMKPITLQRQCVVIASHYYKPPCSALVSDNPSNSRICYSNWTSWIVLHCLTGTWNNTPLLHWSVFRSECPETRFQLHSGTGGPNVSRLWPTYGFWFWISIDLGWIDLQCSWAAYFIVTILVCLPVACTVQVLYLCVIQCEKAKPS